MKLLLIALICVNFFFLIIIKFEVIKKSGDRFEALKDKKHFFANSRIDFLTISALTSWFVFIEWIFNMNKLSVWHIFDFEPINVDGSWPFARLFPKRLMIFSMLNSIKHFGDTTKMFGFIHAKKEVYLSYGKLVLCLFRF